MAEEPLGLWLAIEDIETGALHFATLDGCYPCPFIYNETRAVLVTITTSLSTRTRFPPRAYRSRI